MPRSGFERMQPWLVLLLLAGCDVIFRLDDVRPGADAATTDAVNPVEDSRPIDGPPLDPRLVARFDFDGSLIDAKSGLFAICGATACPAFKVGKHAMAIELDGANDCVRFSMPSIPAFTIAVWINKTTDAGQAIVSKPFGGGGANTYQVDLESTRTLRFITYDGATSDFVTQPNAVALNVWEHVAVTFDGNKTMFVNGQQLAPTATSTALSSDGAELLIGCDNDFGTFGRFYAGLIDDLLVFNAALSPTEIAALTMP